MTAAAYALRDVPAGVCQDPVFDCEWLPSLPPCAARANVSYTGGCVHEHLFTVRKCEEHAVAVRLAERAGPLYCGPCKDDGHLCPVTLAWASL